MYKTTLGRLRITGTLEGTSLLCLLFIGTPLKHFLQVPDVARFLGPVHGALFLLYIFLTVSVATEYHWKGKTTAKVLLASLVPFGTFFIDRKILSKMDARDAD